MAFKSVKFRIILIFSGFCLLAGFFFLRPDGNTRNDCQLMAAKNLRNRQIVDTAVSLLRTGNVVLRMGLGADSYLLSQLNRKNKAYSHCGIVIVENGYPFVYHSIGGEDNPDARMRRDSAAFFFSPRHNSALAIVDYDFIGSQIVNLVQEVYAFYQKKPLFDMKFDLQTDDQLYCAEFVYKAIDRAVNDNSYIGTTTYAGHTYVGIDNIFINSHARIVWQNRFE